MSRDAQVEMIRVPRKLNPRQPSCWRACAASRRSRCPMHCHQPTKDYVARRTAEGRTEKEILRCLKRYIAREIYPRLLSPTSLGGRQR
jgi:hypothetical protein